MAKTPLKFQQIALDNFPTIPDDAPIHQLIAISGMDKGTTNAKVRQVCCLRGYKNVIPLAQAKASIEERLGDELNILIPIPDNPERTQETSNKTNW